MKKRIIYTIGYTLFQNGNLIDTDRLFEILKGYNVNYLIDVRSVPYSNQFPQCNADKMKYLGKEKGVIYGHMPEVGAKADESLPVFSKASEIFLEDIFPIAKSKRPEDSELQAYDEIVDFNKFRKSEMFQKGLKRIGDAYKKNYTLALMCSEKRPIDCHRFFLISRALEQMYGDWLEVQHIQYNENKILCTRTNSELYTELKDMIFKKEEISKLDILNPSFFGPARINDYFGGTLNEKILDFCDRYWNLMHGWKKVSNIFNNSQQYD